MEALVENGRDEKALAILCSDHGEGLGEHGESTHAWFAYESTLRVPLLLWWGEDRELDLERGNQVRGPASLLDIFPTLAEIEGFSPSGSDGSSLLDGAQKGVLPPRALPFESLSPALDYGTAPLFGLQDEQSRIWIDLPRRELYDLKADPSQLNNLYSDSYSHEAESMFSRFSHAWPIESGSSLDRQTRDELEALGYLQEVAATSYGPLPDPKDRIELYELLSVNDQQMTQEEALRRSLELEAELGLMPGLVVFIVDRLDALGQHSRATAYLERASLEHPRFLDELRSRQREEQQKRALVQAIRQTLAQDPSHVDAHYDLAITLAWLEEWDEAEQILNGIVEKDPSDWAARSQLAAIHGARGQPEIALAALDAGRTGDYSPNLDCQSARILYRYLNRKAEAVPRLRACEAGGGQLLASDLEILAGN
jgi:tetratricopeptide (TPR) repeat protein